MNNTNIFAAIDNGIKVYNRSLLTINECISRLQFIINSYCESIQDPDIRIKTENKLYKYAFYKLHKVLCSRVKYDN